MTENNKSAQGQYNSFCFMMFEGGGMLMKGVPIVLSFVANVIRSLLINTINLTTIL